MSSLCNFMDHYEWTPEQRASVALVETLRMKRNEEEQARAERNHARATSPLIVSGDVANPLPPCAYPDTVSNSLPASDGSALIPLGASDSDAGNSPLPSTASTLAWAAAAIVGWALFGWGVVALVDSVRSAS